MLSWLKRIRPTRSRRIQGIELDVYPSERSCVKPDMRHVRPQQLPPLMVRKAPWRR